MGELHQIIQQLVFEQIKDTECFLVDIKISSARSKIQVFVDADKGMDIDMCAKISRFLEQNLEEKGLVAEKYFLEVSSPGIGNPFKVLRQYHKAVGRNVSVLLQDNTTVEGVLAEVGETAIGLSPQTNLKNKKKLQAEPQLVVYPFEQIRQVKEILVF